MRGWACLRPQSPRGALGAAGGGQRAPTRTARREPPALGATPAGTWGRVFCPQSPPLSAPQRPDTPLPLFSVPLWGPHPSLQALASTLLRYCNALENRQGAPGARVQAQGPDLPKSPSYFRNATASSLAGRQPSSAFSQPAPLLLCHPRPHSCFSSEVAHSPVPGGQSQSLWQRLQAPLKALCLASWWYRTQPAVIPSLPNPLGIQDPTRFLVFLLISLTPFLPSHPRPPSTKS